MRRPDDPLASPLRMTDDPDAPAPLAEALRAARGPAPDADSLKKLGVALGIAVPVAVVPPAAAAATAATATAKAAGLAGASKIAIAGVAAVGAATAVAVVGFDVGRAPAPTRPVPAAVEKIEKRAPEPPADLALQAEEPAAAPPAAAPASRRRHPVRPVPATAVADEPAVPEGPSDVASRLREEAALVQRAERLLDGDPAGALRLTDERRRRFPAGALDQEAEVVAIDALLRLGRRADAAARARAFQAAHAGSLHARRIQRLMGE